MESKKRSPEELAFRARPILKHHMREKLIEAARVLRPNAAAEEAQKLGVGIELIQATRWASILYWYYPEAFEAFSSMEKYNG